MKIVQTTNAHAKPIVTALHVAIGFATFAFLLAAFLVPTSDFVADRVVDRVAQNDDKIGEIDRVVTGSIKQAESAENNSKPVKRVYTVRRSVLQKDTGEACIISTAGKKSGNC